VVVAVDIVDKVSFWLTPRCMLWRVMADIPLLMMEVVLVAVKVLVNY
jgi:hypothetical protein